MSGKSETVQINVLIAERSYPLRVTLSDEEKVQRAVKLVNEKIKEYQTLYDGKDKQDYMAMCLLNFAVEHVNFQDAAQQDSRLLEEKIIELLNILKVNVDFKIKQSERSNFYKFIINEMINYKIVIVVFQMH